MSESELTEPVVRNEGRVQWGAGAVGYGTVPKIPLQVCGPSAQAVKVSPAELVLSHLLHWQAGSFTTRATWKAPWIYSEMNYKA